MNYLCLYNNGNPLPLDGPMLERDVVDMICMVGNIAAQAPYCNYSRYMLAKDKHFPYTKKGEAALVAAIAANADQLAAFKQLTRYYKVDCFYPFESKPIHSETIRAANEQLAIGKMENIMRFKVSRDDFGTLLYNARTH